MSEISPAEELFFYALENANEAERAAYLDAACAGDPALRVRVERLLAAHDRVGRFLEPNPANTPESRLDLTQEATSASVAERPLSSELATGDFRADETISTIVDESRRSRGEFISGQVIAGRYTLRAILGEGGMGTVYRAEQTEPVKRQVALKLIKIGMDTRAVLARFEAERQALALMDHPNVARIYDGGTSEAGQPFFVMELVDGAPITEYCDRNRLPVKARLELFVAACRAVEHAHQKGIIHRDLKPSNVMVTEVDGRPTPKVIDFGVAKATEFSLTDRSLADTGAIVGTPTYMSPEQADPSSMDIDTRTDVYALGVILYELLAGSPPLDASQLKRGAILEMLRMVREVDPSKPSTKVSAADARPNIAASRGTEPAQLKRLLTGDLDWIVMKALEKDRSRRYDTANGFAADILRHLSNEAVLAAPPSRAYRMRKFVRKNRGAVLAASLILACLVGGLAASLWQMNRAIAAEGLARANESKALKSEALAKEQRTRAEDREKQAIDAVKRFRDSIVDEPELKNSPALEGLRKRLLKEPLAFFRTLRDRLQADRDTRPESLSLLAVASFDLGQINLVIGDEQDALTAFREGLSVDQALGDAYPAETLYQVRVATSHDAIGGVLLDTGRYSEAMGALESALAIRRRVAESNPVASEAQSEMAASMHNIGILLSKTGKHGEALKAFEAARSIHKKLADAEPGVARYRMFLANHHDAIGHTLRETGDPDAAMKAFEATLAIRQKLADAEPANTEFQHALSGIYVNIAWVQKSAGRPAEALKALKSALAIRQKLVDANPTVSNYRFGLATTLTSIGELLFETGKPSEGIASHEAGMAIFRKLVDAHPTVTDYQSYMASAANNLGIFWRETGNHAEASKAYREVLAIRRKLARDHPESPDHASGVGGTLNNLAVLDLEASRFAEASVLFREAAEWQRKALAVNPANPQYRQFMNNHMNGLILSAEGAGDAEGIAEAERELAKLRDSDPAAAALDARLRAILKGDQQPGDEAERLALAQRAYDKGFNATAARLWGEALAANPKLAADRQAGHRYNAACAAALAASGLGKDEPAADEASRARLRKQALGWLKAELSAWKRVAMTVGPGNKEAVSKVMAHWKGDADLAPIRDDAALAQLPEDERTAFRQLWADVDGLLARVEGGRKSVGPDSRRGRG